MGEGGLTYRSAGYRAARDQIRLALLLRIERLFIPSSINAEDIQHELKIAEELFKNPGVNVSRGLRELGYTRPAPGSKKWVRSSATRLKVLSGLFEHYQTKSSGIVAQASTENCFFRAQHSWDFLCVGIHTIHWITDWVFPSLVSSSAIDDLIVSSVNPWITKERRLHCISRALRMTGYEKRSRRGHSWDKSLDRTEDRASATLAWIYNHLIEVERDRLIKLKAKKLIISS